MAIRASQPILAHGLYIQIVVRLAMDGVFPMKTAGATEHVTRDGVRGFLAAVAPRGRAYVHHVLCLRMTNPSDFEAACDHFGLRHLLVDITDGEVYDEMDARKARSEPPSTGPLPPMMEMLRRDEVDARIAIYNRRVAEAEARMASPEAPRA